jgi:hypothetical protein
LLLLHLALAAVASPPLAAAADPAATLTLVEGSAFLVRGVTRYALVQGVRFQSGDIIEVDSQGLAETEFADGAALTVGPTTKAMWLSLPSGSRHAQGNFYVMQGTLKVARVSKEARLRIITPRFVLQPVEGAAVMRLGDAAGSVFIESGMARLSGAGTSLLLAAGEFYAGKTVNKSGIEARPTAEFIGALPRQFLDPLPARMKRVGEQPVQPRKLADVSYAQVEVWLKARPWIRRPLLTRFRPRADDAAFRAALVENLSSHPEWGPILFPEKFPPKNAGNN